MSPMTRRKSLNPSEPELRAGNYDRPAFLGTSAAPHRFRFRAHSGLRQGWIALWAIWVYTEIRRSIRFRNDPSKEVVMVSFEISSFAPLALGFFGLGTGYLIWGPQELFGWPARDEAVDRAVGTWGIWMPGFCQFVTGIILFIGLTWIQVFDDAPLDMAALAFSAYGIHWFEIGRASRRGRA